MKTTIECSYKQHYRSSVELFCTLRAVLFRSESHATQPSLGLVETEYRHVQAGSVYQVQIYILQLSPWSVKSIAVIKVGVPSFGAKTDKIVIIRSTTDD